MQMEKKYLLAIIFTTAIWGTTFPFAKVLLEKISPVGYTAIIMLLASSFLLILVASQHKLKDIITIFRARKGLVLFLGSLILPTALLIQYFATQWKWTTAINLAILASLQPVFVMIINILLFKAIIPRRAWFGAIVAFVGVYFVISKPGDVILGSVGDLIGLVIAAVRFLWNGSGPVDSAGWLLIGVSLSFFGWGTERLWYSMISPIFSRPFSWYAYLTRIPFWYIAGGVGYSLGLVLAKSFCFRDVELIPMKSHFADGGLIGVIFQAVLQVRVYFTARSLSGKTNSY